MPSTPSRALSQRELELLLGTDEAEPEPASILPPDFMQEPHKEQ